MRTPACAAALALAAASLAAQTRPRAALGAEGAWLRLHGQLGATRETLRGPALAGDGRLAIGRIVLGAGYLEARLEPDGGTAPPRDLVEGRAFLGAEPWPWISVTAGPMVRAYVTDLAIERWVLWQARARVQGPLLRTTLATYVELWRALSSRVNLPDAVDRVQGGEAGVVYRPPHGSLWMRFAYRIDDAALGRGYRGETVEALSLTVGVGGR